MIDCIVCWEPTPESEMYNHEVCLICSENPDNGAVEPSNIGICSNCGTKDMTDILDAFDGVCESCAEDGY